MSSTLTDPSLERLAGEISNSAFALACDPFFHWASASDEENLHRLEQLIIRELAPLSDVVSTTRSLIDSVDRWEKAVEQIIGRRPQHYMELEAARLAIRNLDAGREE